MAQGPCQLLLTRVRGQSDSSDTATKAKTKTYKYTERHVHTDLRGACMCVAKQTGMVPASLNKSFMIK